MRKDLERSDKIQDADLKDMRFYEFWRLYDVQKMKLIKKQKEMMISLNGIGWPDHAKKPH